MSMDPIADLRRISDALSTFQRCFADLQQHIITIQTSIASTLPPIPTSLPATSSVESHPYVEDDHRSELEKLCVTMCSDGVQDYIINHLSDKTRLCEQFPKALNLSPNPAKLALECVGKCSEACAFVLECFLLIGVNTIEKGVKEEAGKVAVAWKDRMKSERGILKAYEMDARCLLLIIACFGIPREFKNEDIRHLLMVSNLKEISASLRRSSVLTSKIPEIVQEMMKLKTEIHTVDIAYTFGIEDTVDPHKLLKSFILWSLHKTMSSEGSLTVLNEEKKSHLLNLKNVVSCLECHNLDPSIFFPDWKINETIMCLEKEVAEFDKQRSGKIAQKRKIDETESSRNKEAKHLPFSNPRLQQERVVNHVNSNTLLEGQTTGAHGGDVVDTIPGHLEGHTGQLYGCCGEEDNEEEEKKVKSPHCPELESLCETMNSPGLRRYMLLKFSHSNGLLQKVHNALKLARHPARLVLESIGNFYILGSNIVNKGSVMVKVRKASVFLLECFLMMEIDVGKIDKMVKQEATQAALAWKKRIFYEGGVLKAHEEDARGLLLLIACFGVPGLKNEDIRDLLRVSYIKRISLSRKSYFKRISGVLRRSNALTAKIPEIIEGMLKQNMEVDAVYLAYTFGIENRFKPQRVLTSFLLESKQLMEKMLETSQGSLSAVNVAKMKHWSDLTSVIRCLQCLNIDPSKLLPEWQINEKIASLENEIAIIERMANNDDTESSRRFSNNEAKHTHFPNPWRQQQRVVNIGDSKTTLLEGETAGHIYGYTVSPSGLLGPVADSLHENVVSSVAGTVRGVAMSGGGAGVSACTDGIHGGISASTDGMHAGISEGRDVVPQAGSYAGGHVGTLVNGTPGQMGSHTNQLYGCHGDSAVYDRLASCSYSYRPSSYLDGYTGLPNTNPSDTYMSSPYLNGSMELPNTKPPDAHRPPPYLEETTGFPSTQPADSYGPPAYMEGSTGFPNARHSDAYRRPAYLEGSMGLATTQSSDAYRPPPYLEDSTGLPNTQPTNAYRLPPYLEGSTGLPNTQPSDAHNPPLYLEGSMGFPNTQPSDAYRPLSYLEGSTGFPNTQPSYAYKPPSYLEGSTGLPNAQPIGAYRSASYSEVCLPNTQPSNVYRPLTHERLYGVAKHHTL